MQHNDTSSNNLFTNIERLSTRDLLSYGQLSYDTILTSIQSSFIYLSDLFPSSQHLSNLYDEYFCTWFDEDDLIISLISYNLCKSSILLEQRTKEYNELYLRLIEHNFKLTKIHAYTLCLFLLENDNLTQKIISISLEKLLIVGQYPKNDICSSIISSSDNILIELVEELYARTKQSTTLPYEALLLLRSLSLLLAHISFFFRALINARYSAKINE
ncbi:unnamed protein product [Rotaria sp. Silwood1]|nr:unnamed protein product [Rotaria sp. Silwood1]CAF1640155.1 unnamed protein product [Rotaria sp. Silwood1]